MEIFKIANLKERKKDQMFCIVGTEICKILCVRVYHRGSPIPGRNGRVGQQSRLSPGISTAEWDGLFINSTSSKLLERAQGILMSVTILTPHLPQPQTL